MQCRYDVKEIFRRILQRQAESGLDYVSYSPRRVARWEDAAGLPAGDDARGDDHGA